MPTQPIRKLRLIHSPSPGWETHRAFYRDVLRLTETSGWDAPGDRGSFLAAGEAELEVMEQDLVTAGVLPGAEPGWHLALQVEDLEAEYARLRELGVPVAREIVLHPWGSRDFVVRDPAGNPIILFQELPPPAAA